MTTKLYSSFVDATRNVFQLMLDLSDISDNPSESFICEDALDVYIGVVGDLVGDVIYRFPCETSLSMVNIMSGMEVESVDDFVTSAITEVANIISGNVLTMLAQKNLNCDILPPVIGNPYDTKEYAIRTACCISTSVGDVCLDIRLNPQA